MGYDYEREKPELFTDEGQRMFLKVRDQAFSLCNMAGCVRADKATAGCTGSGWTIYACMDRLVELDDLIEVTPKDSAWLQYRIFRRRDQQTPCG